MKKNLIELSKKVSYILRREPEKFELKLDEEGWVPVKTLLVSLGKLKAEWSNLDVAGLKEMIDQSTKKA